MWIMTHYGILMPSLRPAKFVPPGDNRKIQLRARRRRDLDYTREHYLPQLGRTVYLGDGVSDYQYRAYCTHDDLALLLSRLALEIDYVKFKPTTDRHGDKELHALYNKLWGVILDAFEAGSSYARDLVPRGYHSRRLPRKLAQRRLEPLGLRGTPRVTDDYDDAEDVVLSADIRRVLDEYDRGMYRD
jgi:hypothetical protein